MLPEKIAEIQDVLRDRFPLVNQIAFEQFSLPFQMSAQDSPPMPPAQLSKPMAWAFMSADRQIGCQISMDQIVLHARQYSRFEIFAETMKFVIDAVQLQARHFDVNAIGVRYLDKIEPEAGKSLSDYLVPGFLPTPMDSAEFETLGGVSQSVYGTKSGILQARFWTGNGFGVIPDDLVPLYVLTEDFALGTHPIKPLPVGAGTLDSDSIWTTQQPVSMRSEQVISKLRELHVHANAFFRSACSDFAFKTWGVE